MEEYMEEYMVPSRFPADGRQQRSSCNGVAQMIRHRFAAMPRRFAITSASHQLPGVHRERVLIAVAPARTDRCRAAWRMQAPCTA